MKALILLLFALPALAAEPIWYSENGTDWYEAEQWATLHHVECVPGITGCDSFVERNQIVVVHRDEQQADIVYVRYTIPDDAEPTPEVSTQQLLGLLTRIENLLTTENPRAAFGTAAAMMADRDDLMLRVDRLREIIRDR